MVQLNVCLGGILRLATRTHGAYFLFHNYRSQPKVFFFDNASHTHRDPHPTMCRAFLRHRSVEPSSGVGVFDS